MTIENDIYLGGYVLETIESNLERETYNWYKESRNEQDDETYIEIDYFLSEKYLLRVEISADKYKIEKYKRNQIIKVEKEYTFIDCLGDKREVSKVIIHFNNEKLELKKPSSGEYKDKVKFDKLIELL